MIDVDDNETTDDLTINGVLHAETDFLRLAGPAPTFHVWTGPRYWLNGAGGASQLVNPAPCNARFRVEASTDPAFPAASTVSSAWINVDRDPTTAATPECYGTWTPPRPSGPRSRLEVLPAWCTTAPERRTAPGPERLSTAPGERPLDRSSALRGNYC